MANNFNAQDLVNSLLSGLGGDSSGPSSPPSSSPAISSIISSLTNIGAQSSQPSQAAAPSLQAPQAPQAPQASVQPDPNVDPADQGPPITVGARVPYNYHGMFGVHGTLRDIIGALGDAFLVQGGHAPVYAPQHQEEEEANDMRGFVDNPLAAVGRLVQHNPDAARQMYSEYIRNQAYSTERASQQAIRAETIADRGTARFGQLGSTANAQNWSSLRPVLQTIAQRAGLSVPAALLPEQWNDNIPETLLRFSTPPGTQMTADNLVDYRQRRLGQIDSTIGERARSNHANEGIAQERVGVARDAVGVSRQRAATAQQAVVVQQGSLDERTRADRWNEAHPSRNRRNTAGPAAAAPPPTPPTAEGQTMRNRQTGQVWVGRGGRWMPQ